MTNELKSLTLNGKKYDSFVDQEARKNAGGGVNIDVVASVGQTIVVKEVDANGKPTKWESADYQPRTHWEEVVEVLPEITVEIDPEAGMGLIPYEFTTEGGKKYTTIYNGVKYADCECTELEGQFMLGNLGAIDESFPVTEHPFMIAYTMVGEDDEGNPIFGWMCVPLDGSETITLSIIENAVHTIPYKYLRGYSFDVDFGSNKSVLINMDTTELVNCILYDLPIFVNVTYHPTESSVADCRRMPCIPFGNGIQPKRLIEAQLMSGTSIANLRLGLATSWEGDTWYITVNNQA